MIEEDGRARIEVCSDERLNRGRVEWSRQLGLDLG